DVGSREGDPRDALRPRLILERPGYLDGVRERVRAQQLDLCEPVLAGPAVIEGDVLGGRGYLQAGRLRKPCQKVTVVGRERAGAEPALEQNPPNTRIDSDIDPVPGTALTAEVVGGRR